MLGRTQESIVNFIKCIMYVIVRTSMALFIFITGATLLPLVAKETPDLINIYLITFMIVFINSLLGGIKDI